ncbi:STAM-binding protein [Rhodotorula toruloides]|uniref:STAM-binding protein n=1 Tax=Rhodotorula toruloides TaxID=5286 RepID=A0A511KS46_RHOTO|nr:STAM-binding protein [Rhodotorula toruloides]
MAAALLRKRFKRTKQPTADPDPSGPSPPAELAPLPAQTPSPRPTDPPPRSFAQLADVADEIVASSWDPGLPLRHWQRAIRQLEVYQEEGNYDMAFVRVGTILKLLQDVLPRLHPEWRTLTPDQLGAIHRRITTFSALHASLKSYLVARTTAYYSPSPSSSPALTLRNTISPAATSYTDSTAPLPLVPASSADMPDGKHPRRAGAREKRTAIGELRRGLEEMRGLGRPLVAATTIATASAQTDERKGALPIPGYDAAGTEPSGLASPSTQTRLADLTPRNQGRRIPELGEIFSSSPAPAAPASSPPTRHDGPAYPSFLAPAAPAPGFAATSEPSAPLPLPGEGESDEDYSDDGEQPQYSSLQHPSPTLNANASHLAPAYPPFLAPSPTPPTQHDPTHSANFLQYPASQHHQQQPGAPRPPQLLQNLTPPIPPVPPPSISSHRPHPPKTLEYTQATQQTTVDLPVPPVPPASQPSAPPTLPAIPAPSAPPHDVLPSTTAMMASSATALGRSRSLSLASTVSRRESVRKASRTLDGLAEVEAHADSDDPSTLAQTESGAPLRTLFLPERLISHFTDIVAARNTSRNIETCGLLLGKLAHDAFTVTHLLVPEQEGTSDTCTTMREEEVFEYQDRRGLLTLGWIHTHPSQTIFLSSLDLHTHASYQLMLAEAIAVVCSPRHDPNYGVFRLTDPPGLEVVGTCRGEGAFHPHPDLPLYTDVDSDFGHCKVRHLPFECCDLRGQA